MNTYRAAIEYLQPIADSATVGHYGEISTNQTRFSSTFRIILGGTGERRKIMNVNTGELMMLSAENMKLLYNKFTSVPDELQDEAKKELAGKEKTVVDLKADTPLANWAKRERNKVKSNRAKMAKASRRRNRQ